MRYWWVNQKQTFKHEVTGGYLWSPKRKNGGGRNPFYEFMREVAPGDFIFSYAHTYIRAIGIAKSSAYESPKPSEFQNAGAYWNNVGWRIDVKFHRLSHQVKPGAHMDKIAPVLQPKYFPLQKNGDGNQGVYLTFIPPMLAEVLIALIGEEAVSLRQAINKLDYKTQESLGVPAAGLIEFEEYLLDKVTKDETLSSTERHALILARRGQGTFKQAVMKIESQCRITKVNRLEHLRASHIKPWRACLSSEERLSSANGLLLTPSVDHLFDRGFISFEDNGALLISPAADEDSLQRMGIPTGSAMNVGSFTDEQKHFLDFHREEVFLEARINKKYLPF